MRPIFLGWLLAVLAAASSCAATGVIRGTLRVPPERTHPGEALTVPPDRPEDAVVYLEKLPEKLERRLSRRRQHPRLQQVRVQFVPRVLPIVVGTTVRFQNQDQVYHFPFSVSPAKRFDLDPYAPGEFRNVTFDRVGVVKLYCGIHPKMAGFVLVLPHGGYVQPNAAGVFILPKLPAGSYTIHVWHPTRAEKTWNVEIPRRGNVTVRLSL
jgi:hypothetical protein